MTDNPTIEARKDGPLVAKGLTRMTGADRSEMENRPVMALCRCGASKNKPFCDGSHTEISFDSVRGKPAGRDRLIEYAGAEITLFYNPMLCSHAAECGRLAGHIFDASQRPWIQPDNGSRVEVEAVIAACPSGALSLKNQDGMPDHIMTERAQVVIEVDGPYWVQNVPPPEGTEGEGQSQDKYVLCRCGLSGNKPYCDGSHRDAGWKSND